MTSFTVCAIQMACSERSTHNISQAQYWIRQACMRGAQVVLLPELFSLPYFCKDKDPYWFQYASPVKENPIITQFQKISQKYNVVLPLSWFEKVSDTSYFNTLVMIDADGSILGIYRKSHLPEGTGYEEKFYFQHGNTGFEVFQTKYGCIGCGICWDQWFPEVARILTLKGAEIIVYPTTIGSEPDNPHYDSRQHWISVIQGHAAANMVPVIVANRVGTEVGQHCTLTFYGSSFITNHTGQIVEQANKRDETLITATFDLSLLKKEREQWGLLRDRRTDLYHALL